MHGALQQRPSRTPSTVHVVVKVIKRIALGCLSLFETDGLNQPLKSLLYLICCEAKRGCSDIIRRQSLNAALNTFRFIAFLGGGVSCLVLRVDVGHFLSPTLTPLADYGTYLA